MKNTVMNLIDAVRTFMALANQPGTNIRNLDVLGRVVEQRIVEALELIQKYPTEMDLIAVLGFLQLQLSATESMASVIEELHGFSCLGMNAAPFHPQGFGQHSYGQLGRHNGRRVRLEDLPADCQQAVKNNLSSPD